MRRLARAASDLRALRRPHRLVRYVLVRRHLGKAIGDQSLRVLPARLDALSAVSIAHDAADIADTLPPLERWVSRARVLPDTCLYRAAARFVVLRAAGLAPRLVVGAARDGTSAGALIGHAWVEVDGAPFLEPEDPRARFRTTWSHPAATPGVDAP